MLSLKMTCKVNGREVPASQFADKAVESVLENLRKNLKAKIEAVSCPVHHKKPTAILKDTRGINFEVRGCCEALQEKVRKEIGKR